MQNYFLFNQYQNQQILKCIWQYCAAPKVEYLFAQTDLEKNKTSGPILIYGDLAKLLIEYENNPTDWPGFYITSKVMSNELLKHLRALLFISYPPESKGILTYYDTRTAHYFFNFTEESQLPFYLRPIHTLKWYGNTWLQPQSAWYELINLSDNEANLPKLNVYQTITKKQQHGLSLARQDKYVYDWSEKMQQPISQAKQDFDQAISLGFDRIDHLERYMTLRANNPNKSIPTNLQGDAEKKLNDLVKLWVE